MTFVVRQLAKKTIEHYLVFVDCKAYNVFFTWHCGIVEAGSTDFITLIRSFRQDMKTRVGNVEVANGLTNDFLLIQDIL